MTVAAPPANAAVSTLMTVSPGFASTSPDTATPSASFTKYLTVSASQTNTDTSKTWPRVTVAGTLMPSI